MCVVSSVYGVCIYSVSMGVSVCVVTVSSVYGVCVCEECSSACVHVVLCVCSSSSEVWLVCGGSSSACACACVCITNVCNRYVDGCVIVRERERG